MMATAAPAGGEASAAAEIGQPQRYDLICIKSNDDGTFSVYADGDEGNAHPAQSVDEACDVAKAMLTEGGLQDSDSPMTADSAKAYWDQLAAGGGVRSPQ